MTKVFSINEVKLARDREPFDVVVLEDSIRDIVNTGSITVRLIPSGEEYRYWAPEKELISYWEDQRRTGNRTTRGRLYNDFYPGKKYEKLTREDKM